MEIVNRNHVKVQVSSLALFTFFARIMSSEDNVDTKKSEYFDKLIRESLSLNLNSGKNIKEVYICIDDDSFKELDFDMMEIPISRESFSKARDKALEKGGDLEMVRKMLPFQFADTIIPENLPKEVLDYILDNSVNVIKQGYFYDGSDLKYRNLDEEQKGIEDKRKSFTNKPIQG